MNGQRSTDWTPSLWTNGFANLLDDELSYADQWTLSFNYQQTDEITAEERKRGWKVSKHCAFGEFRCRCCSKTWKSAKVTLLIRYRLRRSAARGTVILRPFGQACRSCPEEDDDDLAFYLPGFTEDEVDDALQWVLGKIRKNCYGEREDSCDDDDESDEDRAVKTKPHEKSLCEACRQGICCQEDE